jgi:hypothetical protein
LDSANVLRSFIHLTGKDKDNITVNTGYSSKGLRFRSQFIFKGVPDNPLSWAKLKPIFDEFGDSIMIEMTKSGKANRRTTMSFLAEISRVSRNAGIKHTIVALDAYGGHGYNNVSKEFEVDFYDQCAALGITPQAVRAGLTSFLNYNDAIVHRPMRVGLAKYESDRRLKVAKELLARSDANGELESEDIRLAFSLNESQHRLNIVRGVTYALQMPACDPTKAAHGFKVLGLSCALDGSEDSLITVHKQVWNARNLEKV